MNTMLKKSNEMRHESCFQNTSLFAIFRRHNLKKEDGLRFAIYIGNAIILLESTFDLLVNDW